MKNLQRHDKESMIATLQHIENKGVGFWNRNSDDTITIHFRMAHGNDPNVWVNARAVEEHFGLYIREFAKPDPQSGTIVLTISGSPIYGKAKERI